MDDAVRELAREAGIANDWIDAADQPHRVSIGALRGILEALGLKCATTAELAESRARLHASLGGKRPLVTATTGAPIRLTGVSLDQDTAGEVVFEDARTEPVTLQAAHGSAVVPPIGEPGYHRFRFCGREIMLAVAPQRCVALNDLAPREKLFGLAVQLYALRRDGDGGVGDTGALRDLVNSAAREGADAIALSPAHSLFAADPGHYGPYSPSSRLFLNPLYADPAMLFGDARVAAARARIETAPQPQLEHDALIDWPNVGGRKLALLRALFDDFAESDLAAVRPSALASDFESFVRDGGDRLHEHALFEAAHQHWYRSNAAAWNWQAWPAEWRSPRGAAIIRFAAAEARAIQFHMFLQWVAARSFSAVQRGARDGGMRVGLIADLAIGMSPGGSHAWSRQQDLLPGLTIGAPPDPFNSRGQDWGLTAFSPQALTASGFEPFIATMRAAMRHAGGVRIDHVMGLTRLWLIPQGQPPTAGAYLRYPVDDLLRITALESYRHRAIVIGEDLGTVPPEFRARASQAGISGMDVLWFQRGRSGFLPPRKWRRDAVAMTTTHDLPTVAGWWQGTDIATRTALGLVADGASEARQRAKDRAALWRAFRAARVATGEQPANAAAAVDAAIAFTARAPAPLALIPIEDLLGLSEQPNLPGTIDEHPNWRRRLNEPASELLSAPQAQPRLKILRERRT